MKKKIVMLALSLIMATSVFTGCGKSDEQKARDEIMSHMDSDEKAAIAADQKEMAEYEAEKEAAKNEEPIDYSENMVEKSLVEIVNTLRPEFISDSIVSVPDINILLPDDQYIYNTYTEGGSRIVYGTSNDSFEVSVNEGSATAVSIVTETFDCGDYTLDVYVGDNSGAFTFTAKGANREFILKIDYPSIVEKNIDFIKEQLQ